MTRILATLFLALLAGPAAALGDTGRVADTRDPQTIIQQATHQILGAIDSRRDEFGEDPEALRTMVRCDLLPLIDLEYSARLILGRAGRGIGADQLTDFSAAISGVLINRYADGLLKFRSDEQVQVLPMTGKNNEKLTRVRTRIRLENGGFTPVDYAFHKTADGWRVFDVTVEGISYVITFRNQIAPQVEAQGIEKVTADIRSGNLQVGDTDA